MAVPAIAGATLFTVLKVIDGSMAFPSPVVSLVGFASSFVMSIAAILSLRKFVARYSSAWFALYLIPIAFLLLVFDI
jgi:undecaprenyl pyrophosphate phosphatase UppP